MNDPNRPGGNNPDDLTGKIDRLADDALDAGRKFVETDTGRKVADATDSAFDTAGELGRKALDSDIARKALDTDLGRQASDLVQKAADETKKAIPNTLARNMAVGAAAGAVIALPLPFVGPILGALVGGGLGYLRTITKKS